MAEPAGTSDARSQALARLKQKRALRSTAATFLVMSAVLIVIWAVSGAGFFWPVFPIAGMGLALGIQGWNAYGQKPISEADVDREVERER